jgi:hypothetical protein
MLQRLSVRDNVKYGKLYDASNGGAARIARNILNPEVIHLLQAFVVQRRIVNSYRVKQDEFTDASRSLDMAVSKGVIHANNAANKKSAMAKLANKAGIR